MTNMKHTVSHSLYLIIIFAQVVEHLNKLRCLRTQKSQIQSTLDFRIKYLGQNFNNSITWKFFRRKQELSEVEEPCFKFWSSRRINIVKLLALALTNLVLDLANLVTNLAKPSLG